MKAKNIAYIEMTGAFHLDEFVYAAAKELYNRGYTVRECETKISAQGYVLRPFKDIAVGSVDFVQDAYQEVLGGPIKPLDWVGAMADRPATEQVLGREVWYDTWKNRPALSYFVKPRETKRFTGTYIQYQGQAEDAAQWMAIDAETPCIFSTPLEFETEMRCFVHKGKIVDAKHYQGDPFVVPRGAKSCANLAVQLIENFYGDQTPVAYSIDVGCNSMNTKTAVVEVNDFWALGSYGMDSRMYCRLLVDRMTQLTQQALVEK